MFFVFSTGLLLGFILGCWASYKSSKLNDFDKAYMEKLEKLERLIKEGFYCK